MAGYVLAQVTITDLEKFKEYQKQVPAVIAKHNGEYLVRGGDTEVREGEFADARMVILRFPSLDAARAWYDSEDYAGPKALRKAAAVTNLMILDGFAP